MKVNQYGAPASLQSAKLLAADSSGTYGVPMEDAKKHMFGRGGTLVDVAQIWQGVVRISSLTRKRELLVV